MNPREFQETLYTEMRNALESNPSKISNKSFLWLLKATRVMFPNDQEFGREVAKLLNIHVIQKS